MNLKEFTVEMFKLADWKMSSGNDSKLNIKKSRLQFATMGGILVELMIFED